MRGVFEGLTELRTLILMMNPLTALPEGLFEGLEQLRVLDTSHTALVGLQPDDPVWKGLNPGRAVVQ